MTDDARASLLALVEQLPSVKRLQIYRKNNGWGDSMGPGYVIHFLDTFFDELAALLPPHEEPRTCEFCDQPDGDPPAMLDVCPACWNRANEGSGWMQRALKAEAALLPPVGRPILRRYALVLPEGVNAIDAQDVESGVLLSEADGYQWVKYADVAALLPPVEEKPE